LLHQDNGQVIRLAAEEEQYQEQNEHGHLADGKTGVESPPVILAVATDVETWLKDTSPARST